MMKSDVLAALENAPWPALLVSDAAAVLAGNAAAKKLFGAALAGNRPELEAVWPAENGCVAADFFVIWESAPAVSTDLKFRVAGGALKNFAAIITPSAAGGGKNYLLQLFSPDEIPLPPAKLAPAAPGRPVTGDAALKQKLDCVLQLARSVSLDFNNALTGVLAHTSLLLGKAEADHPWRRSLLEVEKSAARAAEIAGELAQFSRQEKKSRRAPAGNLNTVVSRCLEMFRNVSEARIAWRLSAERGLFEARFDEAQVQQALAKVFENAVESFHPRDAGQITIATRNVELTQATQDRNVRLAAGAYVCAEISDNGAGIAEADLPRIFEPFFTTKRPPHRGLGLALVYGIVTNHGGGVAISSQAGKGTSARVYLPAEKTIIAESAADEKELRGTGTILVVDDESLVLTLAEAILSDFGYKVLTANSGQRAMELLAQPEVEVDLVITDLVMPGMGGRELMEQIRQQGLAMPIITTSGFVLPEDQQAPAGYLQKPFTTTELLRKAKAALARDKTNPPIQRLVPASSL